MRQTSTVGRGELTGAYLLGFAGAALGIAEVARQDLARGLNTTLNKLLSSHQLAEIAINHVVHSPPQLELVPSLPPEENITELPDATYQQAWLKVPA